MTYYSLYVSGTTIGTMKSSGAFCFVLLASSMLAQDGLGYSPHQHARTADVNRRSAFRHILAAAAAASTCTSTSPALAVGDEGNKPKEFTNVGTQAPAPDGESPFRTLDSGVKIKDFRPGGGDMVAAKGTRVSLQLTGRLLNLNGVIFYDSKKNDDTGFGEGLPLTFVIGEGTAIPGLEQGVIGMKKSGIRRIIVPAELGYDTTKDKLLEPVPFTADTQRALDSVIRNKRRDASLLFDVKLERLK